MKKSKLNVPRKEKGPEYVFFQVRGIKKEHVEFVKDQTHALGYSTYGEYLNALFNQVVGSEGKSVQKKSRR